MDTPDVASFNCRPLNVVVMGNFQYPHGMAGTKRVQHFIDYLAKADASLAVLLLRQGGKSLTKNELEGVYKGVNYKTVGNDVRFDSGLFGALIRYLVQGLHALRNWKRKLSSNILYCYGMPNIENILFIIMARIMGYKIVFDIVEDYSVFEGKIKFTTTLKIATATFLQSMMNTFADGIVVISQFLLDKYAPLVKGKMPVTLIPISAYARLDREKCSYGSPVKIVYSGSFAAKDGVDNLLDAFMNVNSREKGMVLYLTGKGNPENLARITERIKDQPAIEYIGYLLDEEFYEFIKDADILCMTRLESAFAHAGFPFKLGEYLATGNPVVASLTGDVGKYLLHMQDAYLVTPGNLLEIEDAISYLLQNPEKAFKMGESGRQRCFEFFDPEKNGRLLLDMLHCL